MQYGSSSILFFRSYDQCNFFFKLVKSQDRKIKYVQKDLITREIHVKYQSSSIHCSKVICKVKVSERMTAWQNDRQDKTICPRIFDLGGIKIEWCYKIPLCFLSYLSIFSGFRYVSYHVHAHEIKLLWSFLRFGGNIFSRFVVFEIAP